MVINKETFIKYVAPAITTIQVDRLFHAVMGGLGHILMMHRVILPSKKIRIENFHSMEITPERLENLIIFYKKRSYHFLSLEELSHSLNEGNIKSPFVVFTFDDGYIDNITNAYPIFKKYNVPFTIFVTNCFPENTAVIWWYLLEDYLLDNDYLEFHYGNEAYSFHFESYIQKISTFDKIRSIIIQHSDKNILNLIKNIFNISVQNIREHSKKLCLSWDDIKALSSDPLVTIGAHTVNHVGLSKCSYEGAYYEMVESKKMLENHIGRAVNHFSYPFGTKSEAGPREFELAKKTGFTSGCTTRPGNIFMNHRDYLLSLPRISVNNLTSISYLRLQTCGLIPFIQNSFKRIIYS